MKDWVFRFFFKANYEHIQHLISDVIRLEKELWQYRMVKKSDCTNTTTWAKGVLK